MMDDNDGKALKYVRRCVKLQGNVEDAIGTANKTNIRKRT